MSDLFRPPDNFSRSERPFRGPSNKGPKIGRRPVPPPPPYNPEELVEITLRFPHKINGVAYQGTIEVPKRMALMLLSQDGKAAAEKENFHRSDKAVIVGRLTSTGYPTHELPAGAYEAFDTFMGQAPPVGQESGRGMSDPGTGPKF